MSIANAPVSITAGTDSSITLPGDVGALAGFTAYNASPVDLIVRWNGRARWLPMGVLDYFDINGILAGPLVFSTGQTTGIVGSPTSSVLITVYSTLDGPPGGFFPVYVGRVLNTGNATVTTAQNLLGASQFDSVTEVDGGAGPWLVPSSTTQQSLSLASRNNVGAAQQGIEISSGNLNIVKTVNSLNGVALSPQALTRSWGIPGIVVFVENQNVAVTTSVQLFQYTTPAGNPSTYRLSGYMLIANGVSGNNISFQVQFTNVNGGTGTLSLGMLATGGFTLANGATSFANNQFPGHPILFTCKAATNITVTFRDPTNTPNDQVTAMLEEVS